MHPGCIELHALFTAGHLAAVANIGALLRPTTAANYAKKNVPLPAQLFSPADAIPARSRSGNINVVPNRALSDLLAQTFARSPQRNIIRTILEMPISEPSPDRDLAASTTLATAFPPNNRRASQRQTVAQTIQAHAASRNARHMFLVPMRGFDLHRHLLNIQPGQFRQISPAFEYHAVDDVRIRAHLAEYRLRRGLRMEQSAAGDGRRSQRRAHLRRLSSLASNAPQGRRHLSRSTQYCGSCPALRATLRYESPGRRRNRSAYILKSHIHREYCY